MGKVPNGILIFLRNQHVPCPLLGYRTRQRAGSASPNSAPRVIPVTGSGDSNHGSSGTQRATLGRNSEEPAPRLAPCLMQPRREERRQAMLLAYRLVKLIESHSDGLARSLHNRYRECSKCSAYVNVPENELIEKVYDVYRHLGEWLLGRT